tara:strand:- start:31111 stop:31539 length:429 start_codon:yes stop_codon:yes gene_type:complete
MNIVDAFKARLLEGDTIFRIVEGAAELAQVKDRPHATPAAFVLVAREVSGESERMSGPVLQRMERDVMVVTVIDDKSLPRGGATSDDVEAAKAFVRGRLIGWEPEGVDEPITHVSGEISEARGGYVWHEDTFSAPTYLQEQS